jgi:DNA-binding transcriptional regulator YiaG
MIHAYDEIYLNSAQKVMGNMLHFAVHDMKWNINKFFEAFISTGVAGSIERGTPRFVVGMSGYEAAYEVYYRLTGSECEITPDYVYGKSPEYFAGWSLAYYSWYSNNSFKDIYRVIPADKVVSMYHPYHEMDVMQFVIAIDEKMKVYLEESRLKRLRMYAKLTQKELAARSGVSQRMIEQYEQGRKSLSHASADSVSRLADALGCDMAELV